MFEGFGLERIATDEANLRVRYGSDGPPLLLVHGHPQTHACRHEVAPRLAQDFFVVCPDLHAFFTGAGA
jgi:haloacetate dehalogenase